MSLCIIAAVTSCICTTAYCCIYMLTSYRSNNKITDIQHTPSVEIYPHCVLHKDDIILYKGRFWNVESISEKQILLKSIVCNSLVLINDNWKKILLNNGFELIEKELIEKC